MEFGGTKSVCIESEVRAQPLYVSKKVKSGCGARGGVVRPEMVPPCALDRARVPTIHAKESAAKVTE